MAGFTLSPPERPPLALEDQAAPVNDSASSTNRDPNIAEMAGGPPPCTVSTDAAGNTYEQEAALADTAGGLGALAQSVQCEARRAEGICEAPRPLVMKAVPPTPTPASSSVPLGSQPVAVKGPTPIELGLGGTKPPRSPPAVAISEPAARTPKNQQPLPPAELDAGEATQAEPDAGERTETTPAFSASASSAWDPWGSSEWDQWNSSTWNQWGSSARDPWKPATWNTRNWNP